MPGRLPLTVKKGAPFTFGIPGTSERLVLEGTGIDVIT
jgi:hypothetical protein